MSATYNVQNIVKGIYRINHINALHNKLWLKPKYGVAAKYLADYVYWFNKGLVGIISPKT